MAKKPSSIAPSQFRAELLKIMPGYSWTVHKSSSDGYLAATGTKSSGFNRLSTLIVERRDNYASRGFPWYEVKSAGFGMRAPFLGTNSDRTLARALRGLQQHYEQTAATYAGHAQALQSAREVETDDDGCPKGDPECLSNNGDCHDACVSPLDLDPSKQTKKVRFAHAQGHPADRASLSKALYDLGDVRLVWVNEGDILMHGAECA